MKQPKPKRYRSKLGVFLQVSTCFQELAEKHRKYRHSKRVRSQLFRQRIPETIELHRLHNP